MGPEDPMRVPLQLPSRIANGVLAEAERCGTSVGACAAELVADGLAFRAIERETGESFDRPSLEPAGPVRLSASERRSIKAYQLAGWSIARIVREGGYSERQVRAARSGVGRSTSSASGGT